MDDRVRKRWWLIVFMLLACLAVCIWMNAICPQTETLIVNVLDVGQGDAIFITAPDGKQILIDGGPDSSVLQELGEVMPPLDRSIDLVVLTHPDADHVTGLVPVLERYAVAMILEKHLPEHTTAVYNRWQELERSEGAELAEARTGMQIEITEEYRFETYVSDSIEDNVNNNSVVLKLMYQDDCLMLLTGDIEADEEADIVASGFSVNCAVLKAGHHGSKSSSSPAFLAAVQPQAVVISVGTDNKFGHPHAEVLERFSGLQVYRTDEQGRIELRLDQRE